MHCNCDWFILYGIKTAGVVLFVMFCLSGKLLDNSFGIVDWNWRDNAYDI